MTDAVADQALDPEARSAEVGAKDPIPGFQLDCALPKEVVHDELASTVSARSR